MTKLKSWILGFIVLGSSGFFGCSPYKQISKTPPTSVKDSNYLAGRCLATFPIDTTVRTEYIILPTAEDSTEYYKTLLDSVARSRIRTRDSLRIVYLDTCRSAGDVFDQAFDMGYRMGNYEGLKNRIRDTIIKIRSSTIVDNTALVKARTDATIANQARDKYRGKWDRARSLNLWLLGIILALVVVIFILVKKKASATGASTGIISRILGAFKKKNTADR